MKLYELKNLIKAKKPLKGLLLCGECEAYMDRLARGFFERYGIKEYDKFYFDEISFETLKATLSQPSLFSPTVALFIKTDKKMNSSDLRELFNICSKNEGAYLIIEYLKAVNVDDWVFNKEVKALEAEVDRMALCAGVRVYNPREQEALEILSEVAKEYNFEIDRNRLYAIYSHQNQNLSLSIAELKKEIIHSFDGVGLGEGYSLGVVSLNELIDALFEKKDFYKKLERVLEEGYQPIEIVIALQGRFRDIFYFYAYIMSYGEVNKAEITGIYNYPEDLAKKNSELALKLKGEKIMLIFSELLECSLNIKENRGDALSLLLSSLIKIQASI